MESYLPKRNSAKSTIPWIWLIVVIVRIGFALVTRGLDRVLNDEGSGILIFVVGASVVFGLMWVAASLRR